MRFINIAHKYINNIDVENIMNAALSKYGNHYSLDCNIFECYVCQKLNP